MVSNDDDCEIEWFQGTPDASSSSPAKVSVAASTQAAIAAAHTGEPPTSTQDSNEKASPSGVVTSVGDVSKASDTATTNATADTGNLAGTLPTGSYPHGMTVVDTKAWPGHYITGKTLQAPQCEKKVPTGAAIYKSPYPSILDIKHFKAWYENLRDNNLPSKYLKVTPGWYEYKISEGATTIAFGELYKDWTLDLRDVTFVYDATVTKDAGIYLNQCTNFYVCGGTFWNDNSGGEMFTQAKVISAKQADGDLWEYTAIIDQGYDIPKWREASARNVVTMDVSNPTHFKHVEVNFWYSHFPWDVSDDGTIKFQMGKARGMMQEGYMLSLSMIDGSGYCLSNEFTGGVTLDGLTCNGYVTPSYPSIHQNALPLFSIDRLN